MPSHTVEELKKRAKELRDRLKKEQENKDKPKLTGSSGPDEPDKPVSEDIQASRDARARATANELEAERIAEQAIPEVFTQANLDAALRQGINIFRGQNLKRISRGEQAVSAAREAAAGGVGELLEGESSEVLTSEELLDVGTKIGTTAEKFIGEEIVGALLRNSKLSENKVVALENESKAIVARLFKGLSFAGSKLPFGIDINTFNNIIAQNKQIVIDSRETGTLIVSNVRSGAISPEEGLARVSRINDTINQSESAIHITSRFSLKAYLEGLGAEEAKLIKAREQLEGSRAEILRIAAQQAAGKLTTSEEIIASLR